MKKESTLEKKLTILNTVKTKPGALIVQLTHTMIILASCQSVLI